MNDLKKKTTLQLRPLGLQEDPPEVEGELTLEVASFCNAIG